MNPILDKLLTYKRICILGFGKEGRSTYRYLRSKKPELSLGIADKDENILISFPEIATDKNLSLHTGMGYLENMSGYDLIIKSPGIYLLKENTHGIPVTSQAELFIEHYGHRTIGITGTKGKSTTATLMHHIMQSNNRKAYLAGNIGLPPFDILDEIPDNGWVVYELSAHQLHQLGFSPHIAVILNLYQEHLDHFSSLDEYYSSKINIARYQSHSDLLVYCCTDSKLTDFLKNLPSVKCKYTTGLFCNEDDYLAINTDNWVVNINKEISRPLFEIDPGWHLIGRHNSGNIMACFAVSQHFQISTEGFLKAVQSFRPLSHRMEYFGTYWGMKFYNDSIATVPEATIAAINALDNVSMVILGGFDRGIDYNGLAAPILCSEIKNIVMMGDAGKRIYQILKQHNTPGKRLYLINHLSEIVTILKNNSIPGTVCLFSPAASSYDHFRNFEERGNYFKQLVSSI